MTKKIMNVLNAHSMRCGNVVCEASGMIWPGSFPFVAEEIAQMFCDNVYKWLHTKYEDKFNIDEFVSAIKLYIKQESIATGFTEQQIINSLEKLKAK